MGLEFELKYAADPATLRAIAEQFGDFTPISMETTYYDTADHVLSAQHLTLRRRFENGVSVCTLKTPSDSYGRGEWDVKSDWSEDAARQLFAAAGIAPLPFEALKPMCGARFSRLAKQIELPDCTVELALDEGILHGGGKEIPLCEVEVELKSGAPEAVICWATALSDLYHLRAEHSSKFKRALALAKGEQHG